MALTAADLGLIRDVVGAQPDDATLQSYAATVEGGRWRQVAIRVLKRRLADATGPDALRSVSVPGVVSVSWSGAALANLKSLIATLEAEDAADVAGRLGRSSGRLVRRTAR